MSDRWRINRYFVPSPVNEACARCWIGEPWTMSRSAQLSATNNTREHTVSEWMDIDNATVTGSHSPDEIKTTVESFFPLLFFFNGSKNRFAGWITRPSRNDSWTFYRGCPICDALWGMGDKNTRADVMQCALNRCWNYAEDSSMRANLDLCLNLRCK